MTARETIIIIIAAILLVIDIYYVGYNEALRKIMQRKEKEQVKETDEKLAKIMYEGYPDDEDKDD